ncbi:tripartite tricarboxylate transporter substrate binding protein [Roseomonas nepalensis]|uniref:Tripartite tricarboxylate transporter substrate binding protein n=2 Tax=Muricoccus nepalensis TaxID=1854500 RepID=A0A502EMU2_9PROT|nr:tripartite tricarboxylate transporter substrate binding protein [Roseomonas nepalensis]
MRAGRRGPGGARHGRRGEGDDMRRGEGMPTRRGVIAGIAAAGVARGARAQDPVFPARPVRLLVGIPAGGAPDVIARLLADRLGALWGQPVVVDNRPAASGNPAAGAVAAAAPDGHTLLFAHASLLLLNEALMRNVPFNGERDFAPVSLLATTPFIVACQPGAPYATLDELKAWARGRPAGVTFATLSATGLPRFVGERVKAALGIPMVNVPYVSMAGAVQDVAAGRVDLLIDGTPVITPQIRGGFLKGLALTSTERDPVIPGVPAAAETIPGFTSRGWFGLLGPAGMPEGVVRRVAEDARRVLSQPEMRERLRRDFGADVVAGTPGEFAASLSADRAVYRRLVAEVGATLD